MKRKRLFLRVLPHLCAAALWVGGGCSTAPPAAANYSSVFANYSRVPYQENDQAKLEQLAAGGTDLVSQVAAILKVQNQDLLRQLGGQTNNWPVSAGANCRLALLGNDQAALAEFAMRRQERGEVITSASTSGTSVVFTSSYSTFDFGLALRRAAVMGLQDQALLAKVALGAKSPFLRREAVGKLSDRPVLQKVAQEDSDEYTRQAAGERLRRVKK